MRKIVVFASSGIHPPKSWVHQTEILGQLIARSGCELIYGGTATGLMQVLATSALDAGCRITGIIPSVFESLRDSRVQQIVTESIQERKRMMMETADAFIALPGGIGTLDEITEVMVYNIIEGERKPLVLLNLDGYYDALLRFFDEMFTRKLAESTYRSLLKHAARPEDISPILNSCVMD